MLAQSSAGRLNEFGKPHRKFDRFAHLFGARAALRRGRAAQLLQSCKQNFKALLEKFTPECRIAARLRKLGLGYRGKCGHAESSRNVI
jgi:hypothetical protein